MKHAVFAILILLCQLSFSQEIITIDGQDCGIHGSAKNQEAYQLNEYKNRYKFPDKKNFDTTIRLEDLAASADPNQFFSDKAVVITGYVFNVKTGGVETCNCRTKDPRYRDTHIELVKNADATGPEQRVIVEITPRLRTIMAERGEDWSTEALRQSIKGHRVQIAGWLFYDAEHETGAFANDPNDEIGGKNWRATCWEVHPVTYLKIINDDTVQADNVIKNQSQISDQVKKKDINPNSDNSVLIGVIAICVIVVLLFFAIRSTGK